jgi:hypothetical protein
MPFWYPFEPMVFRPDTLWAQRVLTDLSALHDAGAFDDEYLRRAWLTLMLVALGNERLPDDAELQRYLIRWLVQNAGPIETLNEAPAVDDVFGTVEKDGAGATTEAREEEPDVLHLIPGFKIAGRRWKFHLTDKDSNRPAPHGHDVDDHNVVLDPYTGDVVDKNGKKLTAAKPKELRDLWRDKKFRRFADRARETMHEQQSWRVDALPPVPKEY